jgi:hypothetical protein
MTCTLSHEPYHPVWKKFHVIFPSIGTNWPLLSWSIGSWISDYMCNLCISPLTLWAWIPLMARCTRYNVLTCHNKTRTLQYNICLNFLIALRKSKINRAISVSQIMCSIQTAINPINFALLFSSGEWNTVLWTGHLINFL